MGNKQPRLEEITSSMRSVENGLLGHVKLERKESNMDKQNYFFDIFSLTQEDHQKTLRQWKLLMETKSTFIPPEKIQEFEPGSIINKYKLRVWISTGDYSLASYSADNLQLNPFMFEVQLLNIISIVNDALFTLERLGIKHGNISAETIFRFNDSWILSTPNFDSSSLRIRCEKFKEPLKFLLPPESENVNDIDLVDQFKMDLYSLGVTLLHILDPFPVNFQRDILPSEKIDEKIAILEPYYSKSLMSIFTQILSPNPETRLSPQALKNYLDELGDINEQIFVTL